MITQLKILLLLCCFAFPAAISAQDNSETTVYYFIRHAEKDRSNPDNKNPDLTIAGTARAHNWAKFFMNTPLDAVYSTNYNRTKQTAIPTAYSKKLEVQEYNPRLLYNQAFKSATKGKRVLVVGHSNTTPDFVNVVLGKKQFEHIDDHNNGKLFIVTLVDDKASVEVFQIN